MNVSEMLLALEHVTTRKNKDGSLRYYFRRRGQPITRLPGDPKSEDFMREYHRCLNWTAPAAEMQEGSFAWLCDQYMSSTDFKGKAPATQSARRRVILSMTRELLAPNAKETFGDERAKHIRKRHVEILRDRKAENPNAANERLKILSQIFKLGVARGYLDTNFIRDIERLRTPRGGHQTATDADIAKYLEKHPTGPAWLAMMVLQHTGVRISDLRILGRQHRRNGCLVFKTVKTGVECELPISADLEAALSSCGGEHLTFLLSEHGTPFKSDKSLSQAVSKWFRQAHVEHITAHGVRKWLATRMAERGATEYELMAWFGWRDPKEARPYVQAASRRNLAREAGLKLGRNG